MTLPWVESLMCHCFGSLGESFVSFLNYGRHKVIQRFLWSESYGWEIVRKVLLCNLDRFQHFNRAFLWNLLNVDWLVLCTWVTNQILEAENVQMNFKKKSELVKCNRSIFIYHTQKWEFK